MLDAGLPQNGPQRFFRHVAGMIGDGSIAVGLFIVPDLVASGRLAIKHKTKHLEALNDLVIFKTKAVPY